MRLSEAILLGDTLRERDPFRYLSDASGALCGCGLGGAWLAIGKTLHDWMQGRVRLMDGCYSVAPILRQEWPWLTEGDVSHIGMRFTLVCQGILTIEQLADYVRSIEPAEPSEGVCGEGPKQVSERAELLKVKAEELETMPR